MLNSRWYISTLSILKWHMFSTGVLHLNDLEHIARAAMKTVEFLKFCVSFFSFHVRLQSKPLQYCLFLSIICSKGLIEFKICYALEAAFNLTGKQIDNKR